MRRDRRAVRKQLHDVERGAIDASDFDLEAS
jgi:hypothetical protein